MQQLTATLKKNKLLVIFVLSGLLLCLRGCFGFSFNDEPFIVSLAHRLHYGSTLIVDEWNTAQNFGVLILPLYKLYLSIFHSTEGILLAFRMVYCILWFLTCLAVYATLRKKHPMVLICFFYLLLFSPLDQMTLSYTSVSLMCCLLLACLFYYHLEIKPIKFVPFTVAYTFLSVVAVLSVPYLVAVYLCATAVFTIMHLIKRQDSTRFYFRAALASCVLAGISAVVYVYLFILKNHSLEEVFRSFESMFLDSEYSNRSYLDLLLSYAEELKNAYWLSGIILAGTLCLTMIPAIGRHPERKLVLFLINVAVFFREILNLFLQHKASQFNYQMAPIVLLGLAAYLLLDEKKKYANLLKTFLLLGLSYSLCFYVASDTALHAITMGLSICGVASIVFIAELCLQYSAYFSHKVHTSTGSNRKTRYARRASQLIPILFAFVLVSQLTLQGFLKIARHYWDVPVIYMSATVPSGAAKGIRTSEWNSHLYENEAAHLSALLSNVDYSQRDRLRFVSLIANPVLYLNSEMPVGCFSTWTFLNDDDMLVSRMNRYYTINPNNIPNVIFFKEGDVILDKLTIDISRYQLFSEDEYCLLVAPEYCK